MEWICIFLRKALRKPTKGFLGGKESTKRRCTFDPWMRKIPWSWKWQPTPVFLPKKSHRYRRLVGYSPWVQTLTYRKESDMTEQLTHTHTHTETQERPQVRKEVPKENGACQPLNSLMPIKTLGYLSLSIKNTSVLCITRFPIFGFNQLWFNIFGKKNSGSFKTQNLSFLCTSKYLHSIYISSGIISNIEII